jgi:AcrR family transcriptional regulator
MSPLSQEQVAKASLALFASTGISGTSTQDIAESVGSTRMTLHRRIGRKDAVVELAIQHLVQQIADTVDQLMLSGPTGLPEMLEAVREVSVWDPANSRELLAELQSGYPVLHSALLAAQQNAADRIVSGIVAMATESHGLDPGVSPEVRELWVRGIIQQLSTSPDLGALRESPGELLKQVSRLIVYGLVGPDRGRV